MKKGQILVETIIGVGMIGLVLSAIIPLFMIGIKSGADSWKADTARLLAQEELEAIQTLKKDNWNNLYFPLGVAPPAKGSANHYHIENNAGIWQILSSDGSVEVNGQTFSSYFILDNVSRTGINGSGDLETIYTESRDDPSTQKITISVGWGGASVQLIDYLTRFENALYTQTDWTGGAGQANFQDPPANQYFSHTTNFSPSGDVDGVTTPGGLQLRLITTGGSTPWGNQFVTNTLTTIYRLNDSSYRLAMRFTAPKSASVNQLRFYINGVQRGNQVFYRYGLQADNPLSPGSPDGTYISSAINNFNTTGWQTINIADVALTVGETYYIVVQYDSGSAPAANRYIDIRSSTPVNGLVPHDQTADSQANTLRYNPASGWVEQVQQPIYELRFTDSTFAGNPYDNYEDRRIYGNSIVEGEDFTASEDMEATGAGLYVAQRVANDPQDNLYVSLFNVTDNVAMITNETFLTPGDVDTTFAWKNYTYSTTQSLENGKIYRLVFSSAGTSNNRSYLIKNLSCPNSAEYIATKWMDSDAGATRSSDGGASFTTSAFIDLAYYISISGGVAYADNGELVSSTFDSLNSLGSGYNRLSFQTLALPAQATVKIQLAAKQVNSGWLDSDFVGPLGTTTDWYTLSSGTNILSSLSNNRYLRYKLRLETTNTSVTPVVDWVRINYSP